ncbi:DUF350 domain-containing protein [Pseudoalteromonas citrea]|uniref:DUF350 domain-containing protein n=1 Tax=Pseudoalteromonas citrea TaxID=43655 RepID=A0A5S3XIP5_9GAMM|nr:DUF350 domain-containing protein [Pseudoalteromonas citrea]TMP42360.1 DUF350 domain-containing protein [Pseudoalteromonas citrea]TMP52820.1 DUF350 domain-containing protein [Pseudoalteromonas citrea]
MDDVFQSYLNNFSFVLLLFCVMFVAKWLYNATTPYDTFYQIIKQKNTALATSVAGFMLGVVIIYSAILAGPSAGLISDLILTGVYTLVGLLLLIVSRIINDKLILHSFCNRQQLIEKQSTAIGAVQAASYVASGLLIGASLSGEGSWASAIVFYVLGQVCFVVCAKLYDTVTRYELLHELEAGNSAVAISFSATLVALAMVLVHALIGPFVSWYASIQLFLVDAFIGLVALIVARQFIDKVLFPSICIDHAIGKERNHAVALIEGTVALCVSLVIVLAL